ncbi:MarR family transcriptional regulator [Orbus sturtevantii]|uniref:MarR family winged helix-turn-helix transcriptional regulator n=1 Tax=Orbus sturtevantii TaxID=3074109 RepID=UPI00370DBAD8
MNKVELFLNQHIVNSLLSKKIDLALSVHGISFTEFVLLYQLSLNQNMGLNRISLANKVGLTASGITRVLSPLEKNGIVVKKNNTRDARESIVLLSDTGQELLKNAMTTTDLTVENIFSLLSTKELLALQSLLNKLKI